MVTTTIMLLMVGGGVAAYFNFNDRQTLVSAAKGLQTFIRSAQKKARVGDTPSSCDQLQGYSVSMSVGEHQALMKANCTNGDILVDTLQMDQKVSVQDDFALRFKVLHGGAEFITGSDITLVTSSRQYQFDITAGGSIEDGEVEDLDN